MIANVTAEMDGYAGEGEMGAETGTKTAAETNAKTGAEMIAKTRAKWCPDFTSNR